MVGELHKRGYQRLRIEPGMSASGVYWRCAVTPRSNVLRAHGARVARPGELMAKYSSAMGNESFGCKDAPHASARQLATLFVERLSAIAEAGSGQDWEYADWYVQMLGLAEIGHFPISYADWPVATLATIPVDGVTGTPAVLPIPPGGEHDGAGVNGW